MQSINAIAFKEDYLDDFICRVLNQLSRVGTDIDDVIYMIEMSQNNNETLDVLEECLIDFGKFEIDADSFPWQKASITSNEYIQEDSFTVECRNLLEELEQMRNRYLLDE